ncbi:MAG: MFS transporter [Chloroflexota bacterium]
MRHLTPLRQSLKPGETELSQNVWNLYLEIAFFGFLFGITQTFLNVYTIRLGASNTTLGLLNAMQPLVFAIGAIPAARLVERTARRQQFIVVTGTLHRCGVVALGLIPFALTANRAEAVVVVVALMSIPQVMATIAFSAMFADVVPNELRARVVAVRNTLLGLTSTIASFLGGQFLGLSAATVSAPFNALFTFPLNYQLLFLLAFAVSLLGIIYLGRIHAHDPIPKPESTAVLDTRLVLERVASFARLMRNQREFSRYALAMFVLHWGLYLPLPLYSLYWVRTLHASDSFIGLLLTVQSITTMVVYPILPRLNARIGTRGLVALSALLISLYPLATAVTTTLEPLLLVSVLGGAGGAMFGLSTFNLLLEVTPQERRPSFIATFNSAAFTAGFIAPFIGTALLDVLTIEQDLLLGSALRFVGFLAFVAMVGVSGKRKAVKV